MKSKLNCKQKGDIGRPGSTRWKIFGLILAIGITVTLPDLAFSAARNPRSSARSRTPRPRPQHPHPQRFHRFPLWGAGGVGDEQTIVIQQAQPAPTFESSAPATNRTYVPPRWVDGGNGVQVSVPGYWTAPNQARER